MESGIFDPIVYNLINSDHFMACADFDDYCKVQEKISQNYLDHEDWVRKSIINVARSGKFSSDRTIQEYAKEIWNVETSY